MNEEKNKENESTFTKYKPEYDALLIEHLAEGYSFASFAGKIKVNRDTLYSWVKGIKSFKEAKKIGTSQSLLYWESLGKRGAEGEIKNFNVASWIFNMRNRFGWRNGEKESKKNDVEESKNNTTSHDKIMRYIESS